MITITKDVVSKNTRFVPTVFPTVRIATPGNVSFVIML